VLPDEQTVLLRKTDGSNPINVLSQIESYAGFMLSGHGRIAFPGIS
jgi:hypothetical protein